jgi:hypothetical protein
MDNFQRAAILTHLVSSLRNKGSWAGETHVQKATFFLQEMLGVSTDLRFVLYRHGPFSFQLRDELSALQADRVLESEPQTYPYGPRLALGPDSNSVSKGASQLLKSISKQLDFVVDKFGPMKVAQLERLATAFWVKQRNVDSSSSVRASILRGLKPHIDEASADTATGEIDQILIQVTDLKLAVN